MVSLTYARLRELLTYLPETGCFYWLQDCGRARAGNEAGCISSTDGYIYISIDHERHCAHRLAVFFETGNWPVEHVDHINGARIDNRWLNLRECSLSENNRNMKMPCHNTSGLKGAYWHQRAGKWMAKIQVNRKSVYLGLYPTKELAHAAYREGAIRYHGEFARFA